MIHTTLESFTITHYEFEKKGRRFSG
jgi:hypothetical protein